MPLLGLSLWVQLCYPKGCDFSICFAICWYIQFSGQTMAYRKVIRSYNSGSCKNSCHFSECFHLCPLDSLYDPFLVSTSVTFWSCVSWDLQLSNFSSPTPGLTLVELGWDHQKQTLTLWLILNLPCSSKLYYTRTQWPWNLPAHFFSPKSWKMGLNTISDSTVQIFHSYFSKC